MSHNPEHFRTNSFSWTINLPKYVGSWDISGGEGTFVVQMKKKPNWFVRLATRLILGWKWRDL